MKPSVRNPITVKQFAALLVIAALTMEAFANDSFSFDPINVGELQAKTGASFSYNASTRLLASVSGATPAGNKSYSYDSYGNATGDGRFSFAFDALGSLRQVKQSPANGGSALASYDYDGHQHLAKIASPEGSTYYLYGKNGRLYGEYSRGSTGSTKNKEYVFLGNKLVGQLASWPRALPPVAAQQKSASPVGCGFNVDGFIDSSSGAYADLGSDGLLITRYHRRLAGSALITGTRPDQTLANQPTAAATVNANMDTFHAAHDMDGNGSVELTDALIITRYLAGFRWAALTSGLSLSGTRTTAADIEAYIVAGCPNNPYADILTYLHPNVSGSPIMATDGYGNPAWREDYLAFGEKTKYEASQNANTNWFIGKPTDAMTGLVYFGARWYDPAVARFLSFDPAPVDEANPHSFNRYAYGNNNPNKFLDPDGRLAFLIPLVAAAIEFAPAAVALGSAGYAVGRAAPFAQRAVTTAMATANAVAASPLTIPVAEAAASIATGSVNGATIGVSAGVWTATKQMSSEVNALRHFTDHGAQFGNKNSAQYAQTAKNFLHSPPEGTLSKVRSNGDTVRYHEASNTFGVMDKSGTPRTMFKPDPSQHGKATNLDYFNAQ